MLLCYVLRGSCASKTGFGFQGGGGGWGRGCFMGGVAWKLVLGTGGEIPCHDRC